LKPDLIVINATIRSLKYNGNQELNDEIDILKSGLCNLDAHVKNMKKYLNKVMVCLNKFTLDTDEEIECIREYCLANDVEFAINDCWKLGSDGGIDLANKIVHLLDSDESSFKLLYNYEDSIVDKIRKVSIEIYGASDIEVSTEVMDYISKLEEMGYGKLPVCIAKTQYSLSDNAKLLGRPTGFKINIREVRLCSGAGFIVVLAGNIMTMPGLSKTPAYLNMDIDNNGDIKGLF
jgi:formate--tetrahydrofolate ligase